MRTLVRIITLLGISLISLFATRPVLAFPPMPSSFYGTVKVDGANVPEGTLVKALINGQIYAEATTKTYQGDSVYSLDVPGDDSSTTTIEGGHDGDTIVFIIGEEAADQTGKWIGGTNINLNLTGSTIAHQNTPIPTITQTEISIPEQATSTSTTEAQSTATTSIVVQVSPMPTELMQSTPVMPTALSLSTTATSTELMQSTPVMPTALMLSTTAIPTNTNLENDATTSGGNIMVIGIVGAVFILLFSLWLIFVHKPKVRNNPD